MSRPYRIRKQIVVRTQREGFHSWPEAPDEVAFLRNPHRHVFHVACWFEVDHDNRQLEFFMVKRAIDTQLIYIPLGPDNNSTLSCEQIAIKLWGLLQEENMADRLTRICVSEDGENEAVVDFEKIY